MSLEDGITAAYPFNAADPFGDFYAVAPDLTETGGTTVNVAGLIEEAQSINGQDGSSVGSFLLATDDIFSIRPVGAPASGVDWSVVFWCKANTFASSPGILSNWANSGGPVQWLLYDDGANLTFQIRDAAAGDHAASRARPSTATWFFVAITYTAATGAISFSIDDGTPATATTPSVAEGVGALTVGNRNSGSGGAPLVGTFDNLIFYDRVLSAAEITELYNAGAGLEPPFGGSGGGGATDNEEDFAGFDPEEDDRMNTSVLEPVALGISGVDLKAAGPFDSGFLDASKFRTFMANVVVDNTGGGSNGAISLQALIYDEAKANVVATVDIATAIATTADLNGLACFGRGVAAAVHNLGTLGTTIGALKAWKWWKLRVKVDTANDGTTCVGSVRLFQAT